MYKKFYSEGTYPPSVQNSLFAYLKPEQQAFLKPILRVLKKPVQEELCYALMDYLESGEIVPPHDLMLSVIFYYVTRADGDLPDNPDDKRILRPLHKRQPKRIGMVIKQMLGQKQNEESNY